MDRSPSQWITDYLCWRIERGCSSYTLDAHERVLRRFEGFVAQKGILAEHAFSRELLDGFTESCRLRRARPALNGFMRYLDQEGIVSLPRGASDDLPELFSAYLHHHQRTRGAARKTRMKMRKVLRDLNAYLDREHITIEHMRIGDMDGFLREAGQNLSFRTRQDSRSILRGFLRYLYYEKRLLKKDLAAHLKSAPVFNRHNPPKYLRPDELERLFKGAPWRSPPDLRAHAMARLACTTGLRPCEIAAIRLDDVSFKDAELRVPVRKGCNPAVLPLPEDAVKAIAAYIIGARPQSGERSLFLALEPPHGTISSVTVQRSIARLMKRASLPGTPYWLRHTYAQNLLESGASLFEIKEMLGHAGIKSTKRYLHIDIRLMREVLLDD